MAGRPAPGLAKGIKHVTIDLSASYAKAVRDGLPDAVLVADRFHLVRLGHDAVPAVRQRVIREHHGRRGRGSTPPGRSDAGCSPPTNDYVQRRSHGCGNSLIDTGDPVNRDPARLRRQRRRACRAGPFRDRPRQAPGQRPARHLLPRRAAASHSPEVHRLAATIEAVAGDRGGHHDELLQRQVRGLQPPCQTRCLRRKAGCRPGFSLLRPTIPVVLPPRVLDRHDRVVPPTPLGRRPASSMAPVRMPSAASGRWQRRRGRLRRRRAKRCRLGARSASRRRAAHGRLTRSPHRRMRRRPAPCPRTTKGWAHSCSPHQDTVGPGVRDCHHLHHRPRTVDHRRP